MKPEVRYYKDEDGEEFNSIVISVQDVISFRVEAWESSYPKLDIHLSPRQFKQLYKEIDRFYAKDTGRGENKT